MLRRFRNAGHPIPAQDPAWARHPETWPCAEQKAVKSMSLLIINTEGGVAARRGMEKSPHWDFLDAGPPRTRLPHPKKTAQCPIGLRKGSGAGAYRFWFWDGAGGPGREWWPG